MKKQNKILIGILFAVVLIAGIYFLTNTNQSILSQSQVYLSNGKVYWLLTGSANSYSSELYTFNPKTYTKSDGTQIQPKESLTLAVSKIDSKCVYETTRQSVGYVNPTVYYTLNNPQKIANVEFADGNGKSVTIDGTTIQEATIKDSDGSGEIRIQTQGLLAGKFDCPNYEDVVIYNGRFYYKSFFYPVLRPDAGTSSQLNSQFSNSFNTLGLSTSNVVTGGIGLGNVVFTITADQDYFNSVTYTPPTQSNPDIQYINVPSEIQQGNSGSIVVGINNKGDSGNVIITTSGDFTFSPSSRNENLPSGQVSQFTFNVQAPSTLGTSSGTIKACSSSQFTSNVNCDTKSFSIKIVSSSTSPSTFCGDKICQFNEDKNTCPSDCTIQQNDQSSGECKPWFSLFGKTIIPNFICLINNLIAPIRWILAILGGIFAGILGFRFSGNIVGNKKKDKWIPITVSIALAIAIGLIVYIYFWWGVGTLIVLGIIKWIVPGI